MAAVYKALSNGSKKSKPSTDTSTPDPTTIALLKQTRQRLLLLPSRGVTFRHRHLLNDLAALLPHARRESKLDTKTQLTQLNELADLYNCTTVLFFEARKGKDLYAWLSKPPNGPTIKFHVQNLHTMDELHFTGNCLRGSRPILSFDGAFDAAPHWRLAKEMLRQAFGVPPGARRSKPFVDHVVGFTLVGGRVWIRCYQIAETETDKSKKTDKMDKQTVEGESGGTSLVEIGPRFVLTPIVILEGSFGGPVIYENKEFVSPNAVRSELLRKKAGKFNVRARHGVETKAKLDELGLATGGKKMPRDPLDNREMFA
ncbi:Brix-domain-containing protein [Microthyrium microscopicum]|uniref:Brix-domain-containing protein n=1 Tax=Microthyrium microscopicum TaxID=703497 RepID=A0A6A6UBF5_9PEZI|nr:Brix-domain-containing protein [Microthyrium microscopicum]